MLERLPARAKAFLGLDAEIPAVFLYANAEQLREGACVNGLSVAYYDGAIHAAAAQHLELLRSLQHEFVHHVLTSHGIEEPIWFQEGAALVFAGESWENYRFQGDIIPLETMVRAFPHGIAPEQAEAFYLQAYGMTRLLAHLWQQGAPWSSSPFGALAEGSSRGAPLDDNVTSERDLADTLLTARATPETLFEQAVAARTLNLRLSPERLLERYIASGFVLDASVTLR